MQSHNRKTKSLLVISNLSVRVGEKRVLWGVSLKIREGEVVVVTGPNGGGKTTLAQVLMGNPKYKILNPKQFSNSNNQYSKRGSGVGFGGKDLLAMTIEERARAGLFVAQQNPPAIPGVKVFTLCKAAYQSQGGKIARVVEFKKRLEKLAERVGFTKEHITRNVNEGFSGGEKKRLELLQLLLLTPKLAILDEVDSGLDTKGREMVREIIAEMRERGTAFLVISHNEKMIEEMGGTQVWEMREGKLWAKQ